MFIKQKNKIMKIIIAIFISVIGLLSCKRTNEPIIEAGDIFVINAITDAGAVKVNQAVERIKWSGITNTVAYGARGLYYASEGNASFTVAPSTDSTKVLFNGSRHISGKVYTMYLFGTVAAIDTMFREEVGYPFIFTDAKIPPSADSVVNVKFVNLSVGSPALKVKLSTVVTNEVDNLPYKGIAGWKAYPARLATTAYSFQIRRVDTDALVTTFNFSATSANRFKNVALVIRGVFGTTTGTAPFGLTVINYF